MFYINAPDGKEFRACDECKNPYIYDGTSSICLWCALHKIDQDAQEHSKDRTKGDG